ncbi:MAG: hypothetical protein M1831_003326 [Alyxoria varia]|nr:MAG: hypothetical protein M1831_003326 [Alyxoria varia]
MPRNTRAAKRAEEFEIAQDQEQAAPGAQDAQTEVTASTEKAPNSNRAALKEVTANVIQEFVEQQKVDDKDKQDVEPKKGKGKGSTKGKGGKRGGAKGKKNQNKQDEDGQEDDPGPVERAPELQRVDSATSSESSEAPPTEELKNETTSDQNVEIMDQTAVSASPAADSQLAVANKEAYPLSLEHSEKENDEPVLTRDDNQNSAGSVEEYETDKTPTPSAVELTSNQTPNSEDDQSTAVKKLEDLFQSGSPANEDDTENKRLDNIVSKTPGNGDSENQTPKQPAESSAKSSAGKKSTPQPAGKTASVISSGNKKAFATSSKHPNQPEKTTSATLRGRSSLATSTLKPRDSNIKPTGAAATPDSKNEIAVDDKKQAKEGTITKRPTIAALKEPPKPIKSSKPVTTPSFQLPGEAVAAKHKAQREERQKKQEEEEAQKKANFKARPAPKRKPVEVKGTTTSRARMSVGPRDPETEPSRANTVQVAKRASMVSNNGTATVGRAPRLSTATTRGKPRDDTKNQPKTGWQSRTLNSRPSIANAASNKIGDTSAADNEAAQRAPGGAFQRSASGSAAIKGKEIFKRDKLKREEEERAAREKGEAAKKARAEAATRGRQASREWAEKMKKQKAAKEGKTVASGADQSVVGVNTTDDADGAVIEAAAGGVADASTAPGVQG